MITILKIILFHDEILIKYYTFDVNCLLFTNEQIVSNHKPFHICQRFQRMCS